MKAIYIQELALQYFPNSTPRSAITQLKRWIDLNTELQARLAELHYCKRQRSLTLLLSNTKLLYIILVHLINKKAPATRYGCRGLLLFYRYLSSHVFQKASYCFYFFHF